MSKKEINKIKQAIQDFENMVENFNKRNVIEKVKPKFAIGQKVLIIDNNKVPLWYNMPIKCENIEDGFKEIEIKTIIIGKNRDLNYQGCACEKKEEEIGIAYNSHWDENYPEDKIWNSLSEAVKDNKKEFERERKEYLKQIEEEKKEKAERLKRELDNL